VVIDDVEDKIFWVSLLVAATKKIEAGAWRLVVRPARTSLVARRVFVFLGYNLQCSFLDAFSYYVELVAQKANDVAE